MGPGEGLLEGGVGNRHLVLWQVRLSPPPPAPAAPQLASETNLTREAATPPPLAPSGHPLGLGLNPLAQAGKLAVGPPVYPV